MIKIIKGTYGRVVSGRVEPMTKRSAPFSLSKKREAELVAAGVAEYVDTSKAKPKKETEGPLLPEDEKLYSGLLTED